VLFRSLAQTLDRPVEIYNFGRSGAALSEYLQIMRHVAETYAPDVYIINIVDNDFEESFVEYGLSYFLNFELDADGNIVEIPPIPYEPSKQVEVFRVLAHSALVRYLAFNLDYLTQIKVMRMNQPLDEKSVAEDSDRRTKLDALVRYAFEQYAAVADSTGGRLLLVIDGPRQDIYRGTPVEESEDYIYHDITHAVADDLGLSLLDLTETFASAYASEQQKLNFENDYHWNKRGHQLVAQAIFDTLMGLGWFDAEIRAQQ